MRVQKDKIAANFNRACLSYDSIATVQQTCALRLINLLQKHHPLFNPQTVLDVGTGTGFMAQQLQTIFPLSHISLNDIAPLMLDQAAQKLRSNSFTVQPGDMETLDFSSHDLIISNLAFQWATDIFTLLDTLSQRADLFAFSCLLAGSFQEWAQAFERLNLPSPLRPYPSQHSLEDHLHSDGTRFLVTEVQEFTLRFPHARDLMAYLKNLGAGLGNQSFSIKEIKQILRASQDPIQVTYRVFFALTRRGP